MIFPALILADQMRVLGESMPGKDRLGWQTYSVGTFSLANIFLCSPTPNMIKHLGTGGFFCRMAPLGTCLSNESTDIDEYLAHN